MAKGRNDETKAIDTALPAEVVEEIASYYC